MVRKKAAAVEEQLRDYELVVVSNPELDSERFDAIIDNISRFITEKGGTVSEVERWGKRKLSYPIKHLMEGNYVLTRFKGKPASSRELEANLQISEEIIRHLLIKLGE